MDEQSFHYIKPMEVPMEKPTIWNTAEPWILLVLLAVQLSMVLFLVRHGRREKAYRQPFYVLFVVLTLVDCFLVVMVRFPSAR